MKTLKEHEIINHDPKIWETLNANKSPNDWTIQYFSFFYSVGLSADIRCTTTADFNDKVQTLSEYHREEIRVLLVMPGGSKILTTVKEALSEGRIGAGLYDARCLAVSRFIRLAQNAPGHLRARMFAAKFWDSDGYRPTSRMTGTNPRAMGTNPRAMGTNPIAMGTNPNAMKARMA